MLQPNYQYYQIHITINFKYKCTVIMLAHAKVISATNDYMSSFSTNIQLKHTLIVSQQLINTQITMQFPKAQILCSHIQLSSNTS